MAMGLSGALKRPDARRIYGNNSIVELCHLVLIDSIHNRQTVATTCYKEQKRGATSAPFYDPSLRQ